MDHNYKALMIESMMTNMNMDHRSQVSSVHMNEVISIDIDFYLLFWFSIKFSKGQSVHYAIEAPIEI